MKTYIQNGNSILADGKYVPMDPRNRDYQRILEELTRGEADLSSPPITEQEIILAVGDRLDKLARSWGYDSMLSLTSYRESTVQQFYDEAIVGYAWRDKVWSYAISQKGIALTAEQFWAGFPAEPERP